LALTALFPNTISEKKSTRYKFVDGDNDAADSHASVRLSLKWFIFDTVKYFCENGTIISKYINAFLDSSIQHLAMKHKYDLP